MNIKSLNCSAGLDKNVERCSAEDPLRTVKML
jgi:hypothetical protein